MDADVKQWLTRLSKGQAALHAHAARVDQRLDRLAGEVEALTYSMDHAIGQLSEQVAALAEESRRDELHFRQVSDRLDRFRADVLRGFTAAAARDGALRTRVSRLERRAWKPRRSR
jgi:hypothetical protein